MGTKLLFLIGIVATHGAVYAALTRVQDAPAPPIVSSCVYAPEDTTHFQPAAEMLAMRVSTVSTLESMQP